MDIQMPQPFSVLSVISAMSFIEGIGDEVTILASILIIVTTVLVAWFSTSVANTRASLRIQQPSAPGQSGQTDNVEDLGPRIEDIYNEWDGDTEENSESAPGGENLVESASGAANSRQQDVEEFQATDSQTVTSIESKSERTKDDSASCEEQNNVLRNRLSGQTYPTSDNQDSTSPNQELLTSTDSSVRDVDQSDDGLQTVDPSNHQTFDQSAVPTHADNQEQATEGSVCIRIKYLTDRERVVYADPSETLGAFRQRIFSEEITSGQTVRLIFNGHLLQDDTSSLDDLSLTQNCVIHCLLSQNTTPSESQPNAQDADIDLGRFMVPLFTCILGFVWYLRWQYRYMFNATSTLSLVGVTTLFVLAVLASWRG